MPPKKDTSTKSDKKSNDKVVNDRTFGLKNKNKSKVVQQFVKAVSNQVNNQGKGTMDKVIADEMEKKRQAKADEEKRALLVSIFKSVDTMKSMQKKGEDGEPVMKICAFFKQGLCNKGKKCKMSHDLGKESSKIDIYTDQRSQMADGDEELDPEKLQEVIKQKEGQYKKQCITELVCKYFLSALEQNKYGWKWVCPNGLDCHYRHCLPPGYVLQKNIKKEDEEEKVRIEDLIDEQRELFQKSTGTPVTLERFLEWKKKRAEKKILEEEKRLLDLSKKSKAGGPKKLMGLTGRALFVFDPTLFKDDDDAVEEDAMQNREEVEENQEDEDEIQSKLQRELLDAAQNQEQEAVEEKQEEEEQEEAEESKQQEEAPLPQQPQKDGKYIDIDEADMF